MSEEDLPPHHLNFLEALQVLLDKAKEEDEVSLEQVFHILSGKGYAALLIILSLPFCLPIQIPGFSFLFGIFLAFIGLRIAFGKHPWWPQWILQKKLKGKTLEALTEKTIKAVVYCKKILHPRLVFLIQNPVLHRIHGVVIAILALLLAIPLPLPLTNLTAAFPILFMGLGLLEEDGYMIILSYIFAFICFCFFFVLFWLGKEHIQWLMTYLS